MQSSGTVKNLNGIWGSDASNVWGVGDGGMVLRWNGSSWSAQSSGVTQALFGVWGADKSHVWFVGLTDIVFWNGSTLSSQSHPAGSFYGVYGADANNVWAAGDTLVIKWNGVKWSPIEYFTTSPVLRGVWAGGPDDAWLSGTRSGKGLIYRRYEPGWIAQSPEMVAPIHAIWGSSPGSVWAVGSQGLLMRWNGTAWGAQSSGTTSPILNIWASDAQNAWAVGPAGLLLQWNGVTWSKVDLGISADILASGDRARATSGSSAAAGWFATTTAPRGSRPPGLPPEICGPSVASMRAASGSRASAGSS